MTRPELVAELASRIGRERCPHPIRVAIDGVDASGKTTLADELVAPLKRTGRFVIRASIDGFHHPATVRYRSGRLSVARAGDRDHHQLGSTAQVRQRYAERYVPGRRLYLAGAQPEQHASVVMENTDAAHPRLGDI